MIPDLSQSMKRRGRASYKNGPAYSMVRAVFRLGGGDHKMRIQQRGSLGFALVPSTLDSPLSVAIMYNIFWLLSRDFVKFYIFHKEKILAPAKHTKPALPRPEFSLCFLAVHGMIGV